MKFRKRPPVHPGGILKRNYIDQSIVTITELSEILGVSRKTTSKILNGSGAVTPDMALRLSRTFKTSPELWLNLQQKYDLWHAFHNSEYCYKAQISKHTEDELKAVEKGEEEFAKGEYVRWREVRNNAV